MVSGLTGLKLIGFGVWERRTGTGRNVTFPARSYTVNGDRRSFALLRPIIDTTAQNRLRDLILEAYAEQEEQAATPTTRARETGSPVYAGQLPTPTALDYTSDQAASEDTPASETPAPAEFDYTAKAAAMLHNMTANERHGISFGLFPAAPMESARLEGYDDNRRLAVALMDAARPMNTAPAVLDPAPPIKAAISETYTPITPQTSRALVEQHDTDYRDRSEPARPLHMQNVPPQRRIIF
jgi:hypothetical protein